MFYRCKITDSITNNKTDTILAKIAPPARDTMLAIIDAVIPIGSTFIATPQTMAAANNSKSPSRLLANNKAPKM
ncbi:hypothetical protein BGS_1423 [Beggiatoa sp. SS]|nr:hypothetical protein BGS_1423 [Beggiatoa sp. SS]